jgi:hypothetical protein
LRKLWDAKLEFQWWKMIPIFEKSIDEIWIFKGNRENGGIFELNW